MVGLVDCNNFYASCERLFNPRLLGKPIVVLSNNDGCVVARSNEAKALGIAMGVPAFEIKALIEQHDVKVFSSNYTLYGDLSRRVMNTLSQYTPNLEIYSIDEAFLDLGNFYNKDLSDYGKVIKQTVQQWTGIPVSVGVAPTKTLAKVANRLAKKSAKANGVLVLAKQAHIDAALARTEVADVWGIGHRYAKFLNKYGITTALQLREADTGWIKKNLHVVGLRTVLELRGEKCIELGLVAHKNKGICTSRSFGNPLTELNDLQQAVAYYASKCAAKLRKQSTCASVLSVFIMTSRFTKEKQYSNSFSVQLPVPTCSMLELVDYADKALQKIYKPGYQYKKAGVILTDIVPNTQVQLDLLDSVQREKHQLLMKAVDKLNGEFGHDLVKTGMQGTGRKWKMKNEQLSPCYTTRYKDLLKVC